MLRKRAEFGRREWDRQALCSSPLPAAQVERAAFPHLLWLTLLMDLEWMASGIGVAVQRFRMCPDSN